MHGSEVALSQLLPLEDARSSQHRRLKLRHTQPKGADPLLTKKHHSRKLLVIYELAVSAGVPHTFDTASY